MTVAVETKDIWKTYPGGVRAVRGVDIRVEAGELMVLVGPSGCGKTTVLRMIAGLERITAGEILVGDRVVNNVAPSKRGVALVFQNFALYPHKTAAENIAFPLESEGVRKDEVKRRVGDVAEMLELAAHLDRRPGELSGGQQQRVALGRAIVRNPSVLLLDEPLSNLDARLRVLMRTELKRIQRSIGSTAVYVTHDQVEAMTMGDRIVVMNDGVVEQIGTPPQVYLTPASVSVAKTIGSPAMNLLAGVPRVTGSAVRIEGEAWGLDLDGDGAPHVARSLAGLSGARIVLGVRPVDLDLRASPAPRDEGGPVVLGAGPVLTAEPLGSETLYNVAVAKELMRVLRYETHVGVREGARASVVLAPGARLHVFDETTGKRLAGLALQGDGARARWLAYEDAEPLAGEAGRG